ncbi:germin-like protein 5-1 [Telopea speciosissima]|uniref:germin-like protein 5-1 n=1 Tax=Telopea speciosissima TaxID=54955 RepID=UPI001CC4229F|nr:germin-like protein 5-1 [Telopea speciosissima]
MAIIVALFVLCAMFSGTYADPDTLQDICVADLTSDMKANGYACKNAENVTAADFVFDGLVKAGMTNNTMGSLVTPANVQKWAALNTQGVSMARIDYAPGGMNPPHSHPRATELLTVLEGELEVGFFTTGNVFINHTLTKGGIVLYPRGLIHFQKNNADVPAVALSAFNSQLPGTQNTAFTLFTSSPSVSDDVLTKAFQIGSKEVKMIRSKLTPKK